MVTVSEALAVALAHHRADRLDLAEAIYRRVLEAAPGNFDALHLLGLAVRRRGNHTEAVELIRRAVTVFPASPDAFYNLGNTLRGCGRLAEAAQAYHAARTLRPRDANILNNLGNVLMDMGRPQEAEPWYRAVTEIDPRNRDAHSNLGAALRAMCRLDEAVAAFGQALRLDAGNVSAHNNLGMTLMGQGRIEEATKSFLRALAMQPTYEAAHSNLLMCLNYDEHLTNAELLAEHVVWDVRHGRGVVTRLPPPTNDRDPDRPLRVGFVSSDLGRHPVGYYLARVIPNLDKARIESVFYSGRLHEDDFTERLKAGAIAWRFIVGVSDEALAQRIRDDGIDILVDLAGHTAGNRLQLFAAKPAPVQVGWIGYFNTTGLAAMDHILMDPVTVPPGDERWFVEAVVRLPDGRFCYEPPDFAPDVAPPPCLERGHITFGSFNNLSKVTGEVIRLWAAVLNAVPGSRMVIKWQNFLAPSECRRIRHAFAAEGIDEARLDLRPASRHPDMLAQYADVDIALDTFPFCGGLTSCEALWMGVPIVTLPGPRPVSRQTLGFLSGLGLTEWAASSPGDYVAIATDLATAPGRLAALRAGQRERMAASPLCDGPRFARHLEAALRDIWRRWCAAGG